MSNITIRNDMTVKLIDNMGDDRSIIAAAKVSTLGMDSLLELEVEAKSGLINFLMKNRHGTPFEHNAMTFFIEAPIFVFREFHRHRIGWSYNETSGRYKELEPVFYIPNEARKQVGKPGNYEYVPMCMEETEQTQQTLIHSYVEAYTAYLYMLKEMGVAKEVARMCLPVSIYSSMYATCNARSLMAFLGLRTKHEGAMFPSYPMREIEMVAEGMEKHLATEFPITYKAFNDNGRVSP